MILSKQKLCLLLTGVSTESQIGTSILQTKRAFFSNKKAKQKYRGMLDMTSSGYKYKSQMGQDQVSGGVSVLCWLAAPVAMFYGNLPKFGNKVKIGNKVQFGDRLNNWCNV